jgi:rhodanese-related sulfurtransferase
VEISISVEELSGRIARGEKPFILDVREPEEFAYCNIGGTLIPLGELPARAGELDREREILVLCHHGRRSMRATMFLRESGFPHARNITGGIEAWSLRVDRSVRRY